MTNRLRRWLLDPAGIYRATCARLPEPSVQQRLTARAAESGKRRPELPAARQRAVLTALIDHVDACVDHLDIHLHTTRLCAPLDVAAKPSESLTEDELQVRAGPAAPRPDGDQDANRRRRPVCRNKT